MSDFLLEELGRAAFGRTGNGDGLAGYFLLAVAVEALSVVHVAAAEVA